MIKTILPTRRIITPTNKVAMVTMEETIRTDITTTKITIIITTTRKGG